MTLTHHPSPAALLEAAHSLLMADEALNNLPIGILHRGSATATGAGDDTGGWLMATVDGDAGAPVLMALCTPPFNLILVGAAAGVPDEALALLSAHLAASGFAVPGVLGEKALAERFAALHAGGAFRLHLAMRTMRLDAPPAIPDVPGRARPAQAADVYFAAYWLRAFGEECGVEVPTIPEAAEAIAVHAERGSLLIWEDAAGRPAAMAAVGRTTPGGATVSDVYTPPPLRGAGYASACVATLSARLFAQGHRFCCLFADAANPISCGIYQKLGYRDVGTWADLRFTTG